MKQVSVGMFKLPGLAFDRDEMPDDLRDEMVEWSESSNCGIFMTDRLWSFKSEGHRDFFLLRWADRVPKKDKE
jgi:hypothetical protein